MKKILGVLLIMTIIMGLSACGSDSDSEPKKPNSHTEYIEELQPVPPIPNDAPPVSETTKKDQNAVMFNLFNAIGIGINEVYISESKKNDWKENIVDGLAVEEEQINTTSEVDKELINFPNETAVNVEYLPLNRQTTWDIKVVDVKGKEYIYPNLDFLTINSITLMLESGKPEVLISVND